LIPIAGLALIERLIDSLRAAEVTTITIGVGWLGDQIIDHFKKVPYAEQINCIPVSNYEWGPLQTLVTSLEQAPEGQFVACPADMFVESTLVYGFISSHLNCRNEHQVSLAVDPAGTRGSFVLGDVIGNFTEITKESTDKRFEIGRSAMIVAGNRDFKDTLKTMLLDGERTVAGALSRFPSKKGVVTAIPVAGFWQDIDSARDLLQILPRILQTTEPASDNIVVHEGDSIEVGDSISLESGIVLESGVQIIGPAFIGHRSVIKDGATVGPRVSLGPNTHIPRGCSVSNSILFNRPNLQANSLIRNTIAHAHAEIHGENQNVPE
jgi:NDP-sugar pyrophosphorylase family protein